MKRFFQPTAWRKAIRTRACLVWVIAMILSMLTTYAQSTVTIRVFSLGNITEPLFHETDSGMHEIPTRQYSLAPAWTQPAGEPIKLYAMRPAPEANDNRMVETRVFSAPIPQDTLEIMLCLVPPDSPDDRYNGKVYNLSSQAFPANHVLAINLTTKPVGLQLNQEQRMLDAGDQVLLSPELGKRNRVRVRAAIRNNTAWKMIRDGIMSMPIGTRMLCVCLYSKTGMAHLSSDNREVQKPDYFWFQFNLPPASPE